MAGYAVLVYHDEFNQLEFVAELIAIVFGFERTQALNCAYLIYHNDKYVVKKFKASQKQQAVDSIDALAHNGIPAELIRL